MKTLDQKKTKELAQIFTHQRVSDGMTTAQFLCKYCDKSDTETVKEILEIFKDIGVDLSLVNHHRKTILDYLEEEQYEIKAFLLKHYPKVFEKH